MQNDAAKSTIFSSIRNSLAASKPFDKVRDEHHSHPKSLPILSNDSVATESFETGTLIELFRKNLLAVGGNCETAVDLNEASKLIAKIIAKSEAKKIAVSDSPLIQELKFDVEVLRNASAEELFTCDMGITGAQFGIAETGTLVLESDREFNRLTSLVPPVHICILEKKNLRFGLGEVLEILELDLSRTVTFITGPSRTSDIELTLAIGVHGPGELHVIIIED